MPHTFRRRRDVAWTNEYASDRSEETKIGPWHKNSFSYTCFIFWLLMLRICQAWGWGAVLPVGKGWATCKEPAAHCYVLCRASSYMQRQVVAEGCWILFAEVHCAFEVYSNSLIPLMWIVCPWEKRHSTIYWIISSPLVKKKKKKHKPIPNPLGGGSLEEHKAELQFVYFVKGLTALPGS